MIFLILLGLSLKLTNAEEYYQIEDIPIENFELRNTDVRNDDLDVELIRRFQRSYPIDEDDPKEYFFRNGRSSNDEEYSIDDRDIPRPGGFSLFTEQNENRNIRHKREAINLDPLKENARITKNLVKRLGKPLELSVIDPESITEKDDEANEQNFLINDFIRFKRSTTAETVADDVTKVKEIMKNIEEDNKSKLADTSSDSKPKVEETMEPYAHTEKLIMDRSIEEKEGMREARGATKEQWVKQAYPVRRSDDVDNAPSSTESARAPRVHFVTQGMEESSFRPEYAYDRQARIRGLQRELARNLSPYDSREMDYYQPRFTRNYSPPPSYQRYRNDRYNDYEMREPYDAYRPRSRYSDYPDRARDNYNYIGSNNSNNNRQRRIIYYATLPEIPRSPPSADYKGRYDYRDRYQDRYFTPDPSYGLRKPYTKRYDEKVDSKAPYPHKVSTDVNVRDVKKNPERRIFSEVDRNRYTPNQSYQNDRV